MGLAFFNKGVRLWPLDRDEPVELPVARPHDHSPAAHPDTVQKVKTTPYTPFRPIATQVITPRRAQHVPRDLTALCCR